MCVLSNIVAKVYKSIPKKIIVWNKANFTLTERIICDFNNEQLSYDPFTPVSTLWDKFENLCMKSLGLIPAKQTSSNSVYPWISPVIKYLSHQIQRWYNKAKLSEAWLHYHSLKKECQKQCHLAYHQYINNLADPSSGKITKKLWSFIKSIRIDQCTISSLKVDDITITDSYNYPKAEAFNNYFKSVFTSEDTFLMSHMEGAPFPDMPSISISIEEVYH